MMWSRTRFLLLAIAILGLSGLLAVCGCPSAEQTGKAAKEDKKTPVLSPQAMDHFRQGRKFLDEKKTDEALKEFQETVRLSPDSALATFWLGKVHFYRKEMDQAEKLFKKVLEMDPQNYHAMAMLGRLYSLDRTKLDQAEKYLKQALDYSPEKLGAHFDLARIYAKKGERGKAIREFRFLFIKERDFYIYHFELGRILEAWGQKEQALREYRRAHLINPKSEPAAQAIKRLESGETSPAPKSESSETTKTTEKPAPGK
jgi:tetratricopeptide (TPR) repeat protein